MPGSPLPLQVSRFGALSALGSTKDGFAALLSGAEGFSGAVRPDWAPGDMPIATVKAPLGPENRTFALALRVIEGLGVDPRGLAVVVASTTSAMFLGEVAVESHVNGHAPDRPMDFLWSHLAHWPATVVADRLGATGPAMVVSTACTSGTVAIGVAADLVRAGRAARALVVGTDALCRTSLFGFRSLGAYAASRCRPFDVDREGMAIGEAAAFLLLEPATSEARFTLMGVGVATDGHHLTAPDPSGGGVVRAIAAALAGSDPAEVDHVNAHATGTDANDAAEAAAIGRAAPNAAVSATKGASGHTLGAAGVLEAVFLLQSMEAEAIPPVVGLANPVEGVDVSASVRERRQRVGVSVNLAFGGHNAAVAFRKEGA